MCVSHKSLCVGNSNTLIALLIDHLIKSSRFTKRPIGYTVYTVIHNVLENAGGEKKDSFEMI